MKTEIYKSKDVFNPEKLARELCDTEGKYAIKKVVYGHVNYCLCATPLAIEGEIEDRLLKCLSDLSDALDIPFHDVEASDYISELRDSIIESFEKITKSRIIYGYVEF